MSEPEEKAPDPGRAAALAALRRDYAGRPLLESDAGGDPLALFGRWLDEAIAAGVELANAMVIATAAPDGQPSARVVLLKSWGPDGFVFYTDLGSRKAQELAANPAAALLFYWEPLHRQVRVEGRAAPVSAAESDAYFATRPRASNLSAIASAQSQVVASRGALEEAAARAAQTWHGRELERPARWGGIRVAPHRFEFWQGREDRLHDRLCYRASPPEGWTRERLYP
ncbi:MAG TPA: pyridoxamine 5'-phosphate oxidase [Kofleriaceae bacterium]|nr:pyridoxamine 5'-phosphate oxidase [Kofleriaceae bacterium]